MLDNASLYKTPQGYQAMMRAYDAQLARWPVPYRSTWVKTRHGDTHLLAMGPEDAPPLVLIHGLAASALVWKQNVAALSREFRIYALDNIGDTGKSAPTRPSLYGRGYGDWLVDVFDELKIVSANVVGISLGGWLTMKFALHAPERVKRMIPICPAGFIAPRLSFLPTALQAVLFPSKAAIGELARALCSPCTQMSPEDSELLDLAMRYHRSKNVPVLRVLTDWELASIRVPTLMLVGEHEVIYNPELMVWRANHCIPNVQTEVIPNAGHALNSDQADALHERIFTFMGMRQ
jgi:pimeloyl-ACP methyl ester carboxylesterase